MISALTAPRTPAAAPLELFCRRARSFVKASIASSCLKCCAGAILAKTFTRGSRVGMMRQHGCQRTRVTGRAFLTGSLGPSPALCVEILAYDEEVGDIAGQHALECAATVKNQGFVRFANPGIGGTRIGKENLERLIDAEHVRNPFQRVARQRSRRGFAPTVKRGCGGQAEQAHLLVCSEAPEFCDFEECQQSRLRVAARGRFGVQMFQGGRARQISRLYYRNGVR